MTTATTFVIEWAEDKKTGEGMIAVANCDNDERFTLPYDGQPIGTNGCDHDAIVGMVEDHTGLVCETGTSIDGGAIYAPMK